MAEAATKFDPNQSATNLLQAQILQILHDLQGDRLGEILCALESLQEVVVRGMRIEMDNVDRATDAIAAQIAAIVEQLPNNAEQAEKLRALAASLNAIGKAPPPVPNS